MKIKPDVYGALNPKQRAIATLQAYGRKDESEAANLIRSCPKRGYTMNEQGFHEYMQGVFYLSVALEGDILHQLLLFAWFEHDEFRDRAKVISVAWFQMLNDLGLDAAASKEIGAHRYELVDALLARVPEPDPERVAVFRGLLEKLLECYTTAGDTSSIRAEIMQAI